LKTYLLSWFAQQYRASDLRAFEQELAGPWLVWEPGPWRPPPSDRGTLLSSPQERWSPSGEALVMSVTPRAGRARVEGVRLGRGPENDLIVDDGTISWAHLLFLEDGSGWTLRDLQSSNGTRVEEAPVDARPVPLGPGARIEAGSVRFTFYDAQGLYLRIRRGLR
jgi:hypothetical protein